MDIIGPFIWLRTFVYTTYSYEETKAYSFFALALITLVGTCFCWSKFKPKDNSSWDASIGNEKNIQLACFCTEEDICHRLIVAGILFNIGANMECKETIAKFSQIVKIENAEW